MKRIELKDDSRLRYMDKIGEIRSAISYSKRRSTRQEKLTWALILLTFVLIYVMFQTST